MKKIYNACLIVLSFVAYFAADSTPMHAGIFDLTHFVDVTKIGIGCEPEVMVINHIDKEFSLGLNFRGAYGLSTGTNLHLGLGSTTGSRRFGVQAILTQMLMSDVNAQPGFGVALGLGWSSYLHNGYWQVILSPFFHKALSLGFSVLEPFFNYLLIAELSAGKYTVLSGLVVGTHVHHSASWSSIIEFGFPLNGLDTYISGGVIYYY